MARDQAGGHAAQAREHIRASGLLAATAPPALGGGGLGWRAFHRGLRRLARADSALAHVYAFHHLQLATVQLFGTPAQQEALIGTTLRERLFWGNALNPGDRRALALEDGEGYRFDGPKSYASGAVGADWLTVSAWHSASVSLVIAAVPTQRVGLRVRATGTPSASARPTAAASGWSACGSNPPRCCCAPGSRRACARRCARSSHSWCW